MNIKTENSPRISISIDFDRKPHSEVQNHRRSYKNLIRIMNNDKQIHRWIQIPYDSNSESQNALTSKQLKRSKERKIESTDKTAKKLNVKMKPFYKIFILYS